MKIKHYPLFDIKTVEEIYSKKDGVPVTYVCTTGQPNSTMAADVFYRETPHPEFGNRYFCIFLSPSHGGFAIASADWVEDLLFGMIQSEGYWYYSSHRHDMVTTAVGSIDGGRAYVRVLGNPAPKATFFVVRDGQFVEEKK